MATEFLANEFTTTLDGAITDGALTLNLLSTTGVGINPCPVAPFRLRIDDELMLVNNRTGVVCFNITRAVENTTAANHADGSTIRQVLTVAGLQDAVGTQSFAPIGSTFITVTDETATLTNSRQLIAGTNITLDTSIAGDLTINASGGGGGTPGGSDTQYQFNDATAFGGASGALYSKATLHSAFGPNASLGTQATVRIDEDFTPAGVLSELKRLLYVRSDYVPTSDQVGIIPVLYGYYADLVTGGTKNIAQIDGAFFNAEHGGSGTLARAFGAYAIAGGTSTGTVTLAVAFRGETTNTNAGGTLTNAASFYALTSNSGTVTNGYGYYLESVAGTKSYGFWADEAAATHYLWFNSDGVLAITEASNQAKLSLYNSGFTKFTSGSANYERSILQWTSNVLEFGAQAGGTGTLRAVRFVGDNFILGGHTAIGDAANVNDPLIVSYLFDEFAATTDADAVLGLYAEANLNPPGNQTSTTVIAVSGVASKSGTFNSGVMTGVLGQAYIESSGTMSEAKGGFFSVQHTGGGTITAAYGLQVGAFANVGGGTLTTLCGLKVDDVTVGATNYAIYTGSGLVRLGGAVTGSSSIKSIAATGGIGYATGAGGASTQSTSKSDTVTASPNPSVCGSITMNNAALNAGVIVSFTFTNSAIANTDVLVLNHISGGTIGSYLLNAQCGAGSAVINVRNTSAGNLSDAVVIQWALVKGVNS